MSARADDARRMAENYRALAETTDPVDRRRFLRMADWWQNHAAELERSDHKTESDP
jgi:hypothetical protein